MHSKYALSKWDASDFKQINIYFVRHSFLSARFARPVRLGIQSYTAGKINCHRIPEGTSEERKEFLLSICPELRRIEFRAHADKVGTLISTSRNTNKSLEEQKKDFFAEVLGMAKSAGQLPTLQLAKKKKKRKRKRRR